MKQLALALALLARSAMAREPFVVADRGCTLPDATGAPFRSPDARGTSLESRGWLTVTCQSVLPGSAPEKTVRFDGEQADWVCQTPFGETRFWHATVMPSGHVVIVCKLARPGGSRSPATGP